jgi:hypothetical protein
LYQEKSVSFAEELVETEEFVAFDRSPGSSDGEEYEGVGPIQESKNQRLPELHESVAEMAETGIDVSWEDGPSSLNQEAATSAASGGGHAFSSALPGKAMRWCQ